MEKLASYKCSSLLLKVITYSLKSFITLAPDPDPGSGIQHILSEAAGVERRHLESIL
jgi:hypothetical protein